MCNLSQNGLHELDLEQKTELTVALDFQHFSAFLFKFIWAKFNVLLWK